MTLGARPVYPIYVHRPVYRGFALCTGLCTAVGGHIGIYRYTACIPYMCIHRIRAVHAYTCIYAIHPMHMGMYIACISGMWCIPCI